VRVVVAGGAGFVGSHLVERLVADGHAVACIDDYVTGSRRNLEGVINHPRFHLIHADVAHAPDLNADVIFHLASPASPVDYERLPLETMAANSLGTWRLAEIAVRANAHLLYVSTSEVYGDPLVHPQPETYFGNVDPIGPRSCYDEGKRFGEALVMSMRRAKGLSGSIVRVFNTYGPRMRRDDGRVIPELVSAALEGRPLTVHGDGSQTRSFQYVDDLVAGLIHVGLDRRTDGEVFNVGNPYEVTMRELAHRIAALVDPSLPIVEIPSRPGDPQRRKPDITRMITTFGWQPTVPLDVGLRRTIDAFQHPTPRVPAETVLHVSPAAEPHKVPVGWAIPAVQEPSA
jgi:nucleoside-diphosphate-sugar epimerase